MVRIVPASAAVAFEQELAALAGAPDTLVKRQKKAFYNAKRRLEELREETRAGGDKEAVRVLDKQVRELSAISRRLFLAK